MLAMPHGGSDMFECVAGKLSKGDVLWYGGGERSPLYNHPRVNTSYAIFAANRYKVHTQ